MVCLPRNCLVSKWSFAVACFHTLVGNNLLRPPEGPLTLPLPAFWAVLGAEMIDKKFHEALSRITLYQFIRVYKELSLVDFVPSFGGLFTMFLQRHLEMRAVLREVRHHLDGAIESGELWRDECDDQKTPFLFDKLRYLVEVNRCVILY